jgi:hypothetical protein
LGYERYKKVSAFVFPAAAKRSVFRLAPFRNRAQIVTAKVTFSNNLASAL